MTNASPAEEQLEKLRIRELVENSIVWRDAGDWTRFQTAWHPDGRMVATFFQGGVEQFVAASRAAWERGGTLIHMLGGSAIDLSGHRAVVQTKMTMSQRATVHDVQVDAFCTGRLFDFVERREGRWGLVLRQPIYERDRVDPVRPGSAPDLDQELLMSFPEGYRHMAYLQTKLGLTVRRDMPGLRGPDVEALYDRGRKWLAGGPAE